ncbi:hypothetical protein J6590_002170 [Homalodisca vitripennis]|nr:hypothetical protein J6590_002170 [Homalodisca vitripennis]
MENIHKNPVILDVPDDDVSLLNHIRCLHQLLGDTVELLNSFHGCQVFACFAFALEEIICLPVFLASIYKDVIESENKNMLFEIFIIQITFNGFQFLQIWLTLHNSLATSTEAKEPWMQFQALSQNVPGAYNYLKAFASPPIFPPVYS